MSKTSLVLGPNLELPLNTVTQKIAFLASSGVGKTYAATKLAEEMYRAGQQFVALDPVGVWYGLRLKADGKTPSDIDIPVFGGLHGDLPIEKEHGRLLAQLVATKGLRCVIDVSLMRKNERIHFATEFLEELFYLKKTNRSALHLFFEEAQFFAPEERGPTDARLTGAVQDVCCVGRNYGIGYTLISLAPQLIQKRVLNLVQILFCLQISGKHERKAIDEWASDKGLDSETVEMSSIQTLQTGEAFLWSPRVLKRMDKVKIGTKTTFDASATPDDATEVVKLGSIDLEALGTEMKALAIEVKASTPDALKKRIVELEKKLAETEECAHEGEPTGLVHKAMYDQALQERDTLEEERDALDRALTRKNERIAEIMRSIENAGLVAASVTREIGESYQALQELAGVEDVEPVSQRETRVDWDRVAETDFQKISEPVRPVTRKFTASEPHRASEPTKIRGGGRRMLAALVTHPDGIDKAQLRMLSNLKKGGTFDTYMSDLRKAGYMEQDGNLYRPTAQGMRAVKAMPDVEVARPKSIDELLTGWKKKIRGSGKKMFDVIVARGKKGITREELIFKAELSQGGTFDTYLSLIRRTGLFEFGRGKGGVIKLRDDLHTLCAS